MRAQSSRISTHSWKKSRLPNVTVEQMTLDQSDLFLTGRKTDIQVQPRSTLRLKVSKHVLSIWLFI